MLLTKEVEVVINTKTFKHYKELGYNFEHVGDSILVKIDDLTCGSRAPVDVQCDYCGNIIQMRYHRYCLSIKNNPKNACSNCIQYKTSETVMKKYGTDNYFKTEAFKDEIKSICLEKYGVENVSQSQEIKDKRTKTLIDRYGVENAFQAEEFKQKAKETNMKKYGCEYIQQSEEVRRRTYATNLEKYGFPIASQNEEVINKREETMMERYGVRNISQNPIFAQKFRQTCMERYGVDHPNKNPEILAKILNTRYKHGTTPTSLQQLYLHKLYHGELNYPISYYNADICLTQDKIDIEYDGGGHDLRVKFGGLTQEEFKRKEIIRSTVIKREGYKQIKIISSKDYLPSDDILLQMLEQAKEYFNTTNHTWVEYNIDSSIMRNAEHKEGVFFDFGELRKLKRVG